jgi:hypothetical protein
MVSDRPSAWLFGLASHLANSVLLVLFWAMVIEPNLAWPRILSGLAWRIVLAFTLEDELPEFARIVVSIDGLSACSVTRK